MKKEEKDFYIEKITEIINTTSSKLSKKDLEYLIVIREKIKATKTKKGITKCLKMFLTLFDITDFFD